MTSAKGGEFRTVPVDTSFVTCGARYQELAFDVSPTEDLLALAAPAPQSGLYLGKPFQTDSGSYAIRWARVPLAIDSIRDGGPLRQVRFSSHGRFLGLRTGATEQMGAFHLLDLDVVRARLRRDFPDQGW